MTEPGPSAEEIAARSAAEIAAGRLPLQAQWRIAEQRERRDRGEPGSFTSDLTTEEFAAIRSVGFSAVGQVLGSAVYNIGTSWTGCGYYTYGYTGRMNRYAGAAPVVPLEATQRLLEEARHRAVDRMREECAGLGGDGVVGVHLAIRNFYGNGLEFTALGTAVRADGRRHPRRPFTSDLSGQDFAKLIRSGWVPVALVQGVGAMIRHDDWLQANQTMSWTNQELIGPTELVRAAREAAREELRADAARAGAHTVILRETELQVFEARCYGGGEGEDHLVNAYMWGTAISPFDVKQRDRAEPPLQIMRLNPTKGSR